MFIRNCSQNKKIEDLDYTSKALQFRPMLDVIGNPEITSSEFTTDKITVSDLLNTQENMDSIRDIGATIKINAKLNFVNKGNAIAKISEIIWCDTLSGSDEIRKYLFNKKLREEMFKEYPDSDYYKITDVSPGDTCVFNISRSVVFVSDEKFTLHFLLLYHNEAGSFFDTYYWARYIIKPIIYKNEFAYINGKLAYRLICDRAQFKECLKIYDHHISWRAYSKDESKDISEYIKSHHKKSKR